jgi:hypothetical protein
MVAVFQAFVIVEEGSWRGGSGGREDGKEDGKLAEMKSNLFVFLSFRLSARLPQ